MVYAAPFHRLVIQGNLYADKFNTTLAIGGSLGGPAPMVTQPLADAVGAFVGTWWNDSLGSSPYGCGLSSSAIYTGIKLNRIDVNGKYMDPATIEYIAPSPVGGSEIVKPAPQLSLAATLRGLNERAHAGKGRMYLPPSVLATNLGTDGRVNTTQAGYYAQGVRALIIGIVAAYSSVGIVGVVGITSKVGSGAFQPVVKVTVGRVTDTIRSRRNKLPEEPEEVLI